MSDLAVVCPSRDRPELCRKMIESVQATSDAKVLVYVDDDDPCFQSYGGHDPKHVGLVVGPPIGRGAAINRLCEAHPGHRLYLLLSDDVTFMRPDWDQEARAAMSSFKNDIGLVHFASNNGMSHVNWPCVSRTWIDTLGWFNPPRFQHYCQDTVLGALGVALNRIAYIEPQAISHAAIPDKLSSHKAMQDLPRFLEYIACEFAGDLDKLRAAS